MKVVKPPEESVLLTKGVNQTIKIKQKNKKAVIGMLLGTLDADLLGNLLTDKCTIRAGEGTIKAV